MTVHAAWLACALIATLALESVAPAHAAEGAEAAVARAVDLVPCGAVQADLRPDGHVELSGFAGTGKDLLDLRRRLREIEEVKRVTGKVEVYAWPFCEALAIAAEFAEPQAAAGGDLRLRLNRPDGRYWNNDVLIVRVESPAEADGHLYVDFLDGEGTTVHLFPTPVRPDNRVTAGQEIVLGSEPEEVGYGDRYYTIGPPFGPNMILAVLSPEPLFAGERPEVEAAADYLKDLRQELARTAGPDSPAAPRSAFVLIESFPR